MQYTQPPIRIPEHIEIPMPLVHTAANGIKIYALRNKGPKVVRLSLVFRAGSSYQSVPFSASATLNMLSEGSSRMTAEQIAEQLDYYGSYFEVSADRDYSVVTFCCLEKFFEDTIRLARQIMLDPVFPDGELATYREKRKQELTIERSKAATKARELFVRTLFGPTHPYGACYDEAMYNTLSREHLAEFYAERYTAASCFIVCSLSDDAQTDRIVSFAEEFPCTGGADTRVFPEVRSKSYAFTAQPDAVQSAIRIGRRLFGRSHPHFVGMQVVSTALGGYFGSRLVQNLREKRGYTYGVFSSMVNFEKEGYLAIATQVGSDVTADAVGQIFHEIQRLSSQPPSKQELDCVKNMMYGEIMRILDGPFGIVDATIENIQNGKDNSEIEKMIRNIRETTPEQVAELADLYLRPEYFTTVIAGTETSDIASAFTDTI